MRERRRQLEPSSCRERVLCADRCVVEVDPLHQQIHRQRGKTSALRGDDGVAEESTAGEIRYVFETRTVVPAVLHVDVLNRATDVLHGAIRLNGGEDLPVAQLVAEQHLHAADKAWAEWPADRATDLRLADGVERER